MEDSYSYRTSFVDSSYGGGDIATRYPGKYRMSSLVCKACRKSLGMTKTHQQEVEAYCVSCCKILGLKKD